MKNKNVNLRSYRIKTAGRSHWQEYKCLATNEKEFIKNFFINCVFLSAGIFSKDEMSVEFKKYFNTEIEQYMVIYKKVMLTTHLIKNIKYY